MRTLAELPLSNRHVLVRVDFNVPLTDHGLITDATKIEAHRPTLDVLTQSGAKVILMSHMSDAGASLSPVYDYLSQFYDISFADDCLDAEDMVDNLAASHILLLENTRHYFDEEQHNDADFARKLSDYADVFVNDAFASAHRDHASTAGVARYVDDKGVGLLMQRELDALSHVMDAPKRPLGVIIGGAKISTKLGIIDTFLAKADHLFIGTAMANTLLMASGVDVAASLVEREMLPVAERILTDAQNSDCQLHLPIDVLTETGVHTLPDALPAGGFIGDIGPATLSLWQDLLLGCETVLWNGPVGKFEDDRFSSGSFTLAAFLANHPGFTVAGGGDTLAAIHHADISGQFSFLSTGGGAMLTLLEGHDLPGLTALQGTF